MKNKKIRYSRNMIYFIASYPLLPVFSSTVQPADEKTQLTVKNQIAVINIAAPNRVASLQYVSWRQ